MSTTTLDDHCHSHAIRALKQDAAATSTHTTIDPIIVRLYREHSSAIASLGKTIQADELNAKRDAALRTLVTAQAALRTAAAAP